MVSIWKTGRVMETRIRLSAVQGGCKALLGAHVLEQDVQQCCIPITGSCFLFSFPYFLEHRKEGGEDGLCMDPGVCCVPGCNTWVCSGLLELCCGLFWLARLNSSGFGTALGNCVDFLFCCCSVAQSFIYMMY